MVAITTNTIELSKPLTVEEFTELVRIALIPAVVTDDSIVEVRPNNGRLQLLGIKLTDHAILQLQPMGQQAWSAFTDDCRHRYVQVIVRDESDDADLDTTKIYATVFRGIIEMAHQAINEHGIETARRLLYDDENDDG